MPSNGVINRTTNISKREKIATESAAIFLA